MPSREEILKALEVVIDPDLRRSIVYGLGVLRVKVQGSLFRMGLYQHPRFDGLRRGQA